VTLAAPSSSLAWRSSASRVARRLPPVWFSADASPWVQHKMWTAAPSAATRWMMPNPVTSWWAPRRSSRRHTPQCVTGEHLNAAALNLGIGQLELDALKPRQRLAELLPHQLSFVRARMAELRGDANTARELAQECPHRLPGHQGSADLAVRVGAELPMSSRDKLAGQAHLEAATTPG